MPLLTMWDFSLEIFQIPPSAILMEKKIMSCVDNFLKSDVYLYRWYVHGHWGHWSHDQGLLPRFWHPNEGVWDGRSYGKETFIFYFFSLFLSEIFHFVVANDVQVDTCEILFFWKCGKAFCILPLWSGSVGFHFNKDCLNKSFLLSGQGCSRPI